MFTNKCLQAFDRIKEALISVLIIQPPNQSPLFEFMCDASDFSVGADLGQRRDKRPFVMYYASKMIDDA